MDDDNRKTSRETCASSSSPSSSPLTPGIDPLQPDPMLAGFASQSATLDSIGAWSSVQPMPSAPSAADTGLQAHGMVSDMHDLDKKYSRMAVAHGLQAQHIGLAESNDARPDASSVDVDYSELDEAILRGRSTTLPNIFAMQNPLYRFSTANGAEVPAPTGSVSPMSTSGFGMLPRNGSLSVANNNNRAVSPLGLSLSAIPIHQTTSLDRQLTTPRDQGDRFDMFGAPIGLGKASAGLSGSFSSTSSLVSANNASAAPVRRFSEHMAIDPQMPSLGLTSYSMGPGAFPSGGNTSSGHTDYAGEGVISSGVTHDVASAGAVISGHSAPSTRASAGGMFSTTRGADGSLYQKTSATARYGGFGTNLPTMREEDASAELLAPSLPPSTFLMRNSSLPSATSPPVAAMPQPLGSGASDAGLFPSKDGMSRSPTYDASSAAAEPRGNFVATAQVADQDVHGSSAYQPPRVQSLKDMRRPSLDMRGEPSDDMGAQTQTAAAAAFERAACFKQPMAFGQLPGIAGLHRRHSLASTNAHIAAPVSGAMPLAPSPAGEYPAYPPNLHSGMASQQPHLAAATVYSFGMPPGSALPRQNSMSALPSAATQQQPQHYPPFYQAACTAPAPTHALGVGAVNGGVPRQQEVPHFAHFMGHMVHSSQSQQPHSAFALPPLLAPAHIQPIPVSLSAQQGKQPQGLPQHARRASLPGITRMGTPAVSMALAPPMPALASSGSHQSPHPLLPNPATTFTPNMPFADMGKGIAYQSLPRSTRVFVVKFKGKRCDLFFAPSQGMELKAVPALALSGSAASAPARGPAKEACTTPSAMSVPASAATGEVGTNFEPGIYVLVEADRGVDLGVIKEELKSTAAILSFSAALSDAAASSGCGDSSATDGRRSTAPSDSNDHATVSSGTSSLSSRTPGQSTAEPTRNAPSSVSARDVYVKRIFRAADQREVADLLNNKVFDEKNALNMCQSKVQQRKLAMRVDDAEFQFDRRKLTFYFTADHRVDFRELVRDLFKHFKTRIWMCQQTG
ncbi:hypothetical protein H4R20_000714 [Coemansia guatemalensis]|uniref:PSP1 C-terminal domain-containing protein n=1 Tax=Coemansia guatemalensis TaxID=2761395 RepID=A0A9W8I4Q3_9FUNG|nr:hypothetical protein H4R20_000714 [Coemansia guatemalensis]